MSIYILEEEYLVQTRCFCVNVTNAKERHVPQIQFLLLSPSPVSVLQPFPGFYQSPDPVYIPLSDP